MEIPILSPEGVKEIDRYLNSIKPWFPLSQEDYQCWKLLKKSYVVLYEMMIEPFDKGLVESLQEFITRNKGKYEWPMIAYGSVCKIGISIDLLQLIKSQAEKEEEEVLRLQSRHYVKPIK